MKIGGDLLRDGSQMKFIKHKYSPVNMTGRYRTIGD